MARSFLKEKQLPSIFWGEAIRHSIYVLNRLPTRAVSGMTQYEAWSSNKPNIGHIRVFGCLAQMKLPSVHTSKLDDRSKVVINLGKQPGTKGYRLYDPKNKSVHVSRDVVFEESKAWPWENDKETASESHETFIVVGASTGETSDNVEREESYNSQNEGSSSEDNDLSPVSTTQMSTTVSDAEMDSEPRHFRSLNEIYSETQEIELENEELLLSGVEEPSSYVKVAQEHEWRQAMECEIRAVERNNTWKLTEFPPGQKAIGLKWVYKLKKDTSGKVIKHKARIVAKGYV